MLSIPCGLPETTGSSLALSILATSFAMVGVIACCFCRCFRHVRTRLGFSIILSVGAVVYLGVTVDPDLAGAAARSCSGCCGSRFCGGCRCGSRGCCRCCRSCWRGGSGDVPFFYALMAGASAFFRSVGRIAAIFAQPGATGWR